jgi:[ribosomal protein S18]-alanine N-acetyltransferase
MSAAPEQIVANTMPFALRPLRSGDVVQAAEIERDAFPTLFPPTAFRRELGKRNASYLVAEEIASNGAIDEPERKGLFGSLISGVRSGSSHAEDCGRIAGFIGIWYMVDEAHVVSVGVRNSDRGRGIGELLLIGALERAMSRAAAVMTLEVRESNWVAINLYRKYGFEQKGVRKAYYADNREDALIMTTEPILRPEYREFFVALVREHAARWGAAERDLG